MFAKSILFRAWIHNNQREKKTGIKWNNRRTRVRDWDGIHDKQMNKKNSNNNNKHTILAEQPIQCQIVCNQN